MGARLSALCVLATLVLSCPLARASEVYPAHVQAYLHLTYTPQCTLCHRDNLGGVGTVTQRFGVALMATYGLTGGSNFPALEMALSEAEAQNMDANFDCIPDIEELVLGMDPNSPPPPTPCAAGDGGGPAANMAFPISTRPTPQYGCSAGRTTENAGGAALLLSAGAMVIGWRRGRRTRRTRSTPLGI
jgi:hypothetical protein